MTQGYFSEKPKNELEIIDEEQFNIVVTILRKMMMMEIGILSCEMLDMVHDFAQHFLRKKECFTVEPDSLEKSLKSCSLNDNAS